MRVTELKWAGVTMAAAACVFLAGCGDDRPNTAPAVNETAAPPVATYDRVCRSSSEIELCVTPTINSSASRLQFTVELRASRGIEVLTIEQRSSTVRANVPVLLAAGQPAAGAPPTKSDNGATKPSTAPKSGGNLPDDVESLPRNEDTISDAVGSGEGVAAGTRGAAGPGVLWTATREAPSRSCRDDARLLPQPWTTTRGVRAEAGAPVKFETSHRVASPSRATMTFTAKRFSGTQHGVKSTLERELALNVRVDARGLSGDESVARCLR